MNQENNSGTSTWIGSCKFCGQIAIIESLAGYMVEMEIQGVNLDLGNGIKCKISRNSKGELEISRTDTSTQKMKV